MTGSTVVDIVAVAVIVGATGGGGDDGGADGGAGGRTRVGASELSRVVTVGKFVGRTSSFVRCFFTMAV